MKRTSEIWLASTAAYVEKNSGLIPMHKLGDAIDLAMKTYARMYAINFVHYLMREDVGQLKTNLHWVLSFTSLLLTSIITF